MVQKFSNVSLIFNPNELRKREPWDQITGETDKAYQAFLLYRNLPVEERSIAKAQENGEAESDIKSYYYNWSSVNHWLERARAWDHHLQGVKDKASEKVYSKEMLAERKNRMEMLENTRKLVILYMQWVATTEKTPQKLSAMSKAAQSYMEQSRREFGDDPAAERQRDEKMQENMESVRQKIQSIMAEAAIESEAGGNP